MDPNIWMTGADPLHEQEPEELTSVMQYPVTPTLSDADRLEIGMLSEAEVAGIENELIEGAVVSGAAASTRVTSFEYGLSFPSVSNAVTTM
jgi:hypothetical protein